MSGATCAAAIRRFLVGLLFAVALVAGRAAHAAGEATAALPVLAELIPADVGLVVEARDLAVYADRVLAGRIPPRLQEFPPFAKWSAENRDPLKKLAADVAAQLNVDAEGVWRQVLGGRMLLAVWPGRDGAPGPGSGALLVAAHDADLLRRAVEGLLAAQRRSGELREATDVKDDAGRPLFRRLRFVRDEQTTTLYLALRGELAVLASDEALLRGILARPSAATPSLARLPAYVRAVEQCGSDVVVRAFLNPRPWDSLITAETRAAAPASRDAKAKQLFAETWRATDYAALALEAGDRWSLEAFVAWDAQRLSTDMRTVLASLAGPADALRKTPSNAIAAMAGRLDVARLSRRFLTPEVVARAPQLDKLLKLAPGFLSGADLVEDVMAGFGPDVGLFVAANPVPTEPAPLDVVLSVGMSSLARGDRPGAAEVVDRSLHGALGLAAIVNNSGGGKPRMTIHRRPLENGVLTTVRGLEFPNGIQELAYSTGGDALRLSNSSARLEQIATLEPEMALSSHARFRAALGPRLADAGHVAYCDLAALREFLARHPRLFGGEDSSAGDSGRRQLLELLRLADTALLAARVDERGLAFRASLGVESSPR